MHSRGPLQLGSSRDASQDMGPVKDVALPETLHNPSTRSNARRGAGIILDLSRKRHNSPWSFLISGRYRRCLQQQRTRRIPTEQMFEDPSVYPAV